MQDRSPFRRAIGISRSEGEADGGEGGPFTGERLAKTSLEAGTFGDECRHI